MLEQKYYIVKYTFSKYLWIIYNEKLVSELSCIDI